VIAVRRAPGTIDSRSDRYGASVSLLETTLALAVEPRYAPTGRRAVTPGISRTNALAMWTRMAADVLSWDDIGSIAAGNHADLIIADRNPL
jgi:predicted amidohydrolase YtcJ